MRARGAFTLIELMIVVVIVAILASSAFPIYRSIATKAYEAEIVSGLGTFRTAERLHRAEHGVYADQAALESCGFIAARDFEHMCYIQYSDYSISSSSDDAFTVEWVRPGGSGRDVEDYSFSSVTMDQGGTIVRS